MKSIFYRDSLVKQRVDFQRIQTELVFIKEEKNFDKSFQYFSDYLNCIWSFETFEFELRHEYIFSLLCLKTEETYCEYLPYLTGKEVYSRTIEITEKRLAMIMRLVYQYLNRNHIVENAYYHENLQIDFISNGNINWFVELLKNTCNMELIYYAFMILSHLKLQPETFNKIYTAKPDLQTLISIIEPFTKIKLIYENYDYSKTWDPSHVIEKIFMPVLPLRMSYEHYEALDKKMEEKGNLPIAWMLTDMKLPLNEKIFNVHVWWVRLRKTNHHRRNKLYLFLLSYFFGHTGMNRWLFNFLKGKGLGIAPFPLNDIIGEFFIQLSLEEEYQEMVYLLSSIPNNDVSLLLPSSYLSSDKAGTREKKINELFELLLKNSLILDKDLYSKNIYYCFLSLNSYLSQLKRISISLPFQPVLMEEFSSLISSYFKSIIRPISEWEGRLQSVIYFLKFIQTSTFKMTFNHEIFLALQEAFVTLMDWVSNRKTIAINERLVQEAIKLIFGNLNSSLDFNKDTFMKEFILNKGVHQLSENILKFDCYMSKLILKVFLENISNENMASLKSFMNFPELLLDVNDFLNSRSDTNAYLYNWVQNNFFNLNISMPNKDTNFLKRLKTSISISLALMNLNKPGIGPRNYNKINIEYVGVVDEIVDSINPDIEVLKKSIFEFFSEDAVEMIFRRVSTCVIGRYLNYLTYSLINYYKTLSDITTQPFTDETFKKMTELVGKFYSPFSERVCRLPSDNRLAGMVSNYTAQTKIHILIQKSGKKRNPVHFYFKIMKVYMKKLSLHEQKVLPISDLMDYYKNGSLSNYKLLKEKFEYLSDLSNFELYLYLSKKALKKLQPYAEYRETYMYKHKKYVSCLSEVFFSNIKAVVKECSKDGLSQELNENSFRSLDILNVNSQPRKLYREFRVIKVIALYFKIVQHYLAFNRIELNEGFNLLLENGLKYIPELIQLDISETNFKNALCAYSTIENTRLIFDYYLDKKPILDKKPSPSSFTDFSKVQAVLNLVSTFLSNSVEFIGKFSGDEAILARHIFFLIDFFGETFWKRLLLKELASSMHSSHTFPFSESDGIKFISIMKSIMEMAFKTEPQKMDVIIEGNISTNQTFFVQKRLAIDDTYAGGLDIKSSIHSTNVKIHIEYHLYQTTLNLLLSQFKQSIKFIPQLSTYISALSRFEPDFKSKELLPLIVLYLKNFNPNLLAHLESQLDEKSVGGLADSYYFKEMGGKVGKEASYFIILAISGYLKIEFDEIKFKLMDKKILPEVLIKTGESLLRSEHLFKGLTESTNYNFPPLDKISQDYNSNNAILLYLNDLLIEIWEIFLNFEKTNQVLKVVDMSSIVSGICEAFKSYIFLVAEKMVDYDHSYYHKILSCIIRLINLSPEIAEGVFFSKENNQESQTIFSLLSITSPVASPVVEIYLSTFARLLEISIVDDKLQELMAENEILSRFYHPHKKEFIKEKLHAIVKDLNTCPIIYLKLINEMCVIDNMDELSLKPSYKEKYLSNSKDPNRIFSLISPEKKNILQGIFKGVYRSFFFYFCQRINKIFSGNPLINEYNGLKCLLAVIRSYPVLYEVMECLQIDLKELAYSTKNNKMMEVILLRFFPNRTTASASEILLFPIFSLTSNIFISHIDYICDLKLGFYSCRGMVLKKQEYLLKKYIKSLLPLMKQEFVIPKEERDKKNIFSSIYKVYSFYNLSFLLNHLFAYLMKMNSDSYLFEKLLSKALELQCFILENANKTDLQVLYSLNFTPLVCYLYKNHVRAVFSRIRNSPKTVDKVHFGKYLKFYGNVFLEETLLKEPKFDILKALKELPLEAQNSLKKEASTSKPTEKHNENEFLWSLETISQYASKNVLSFEIFKSPLFDNPSDLLVSRAFFNMPKESFFPESDFTNIPTNAAKHLSDSNSVQAFKSWVFYLKEAGNTQNQTKYFKIDSMIDGVKNIAFTYKGVQLKKEVAGKDEKSALIDILKLLIKDSLDVEKGEKKKNKNKDFEVQIVESGPKESPKVDQVAELKQKIPTNSEIFEEKAGSGVIDLASLDRKDFMTEEEEDIKTKEKQRDEEMMTLMTYVEFFNQPLEEIRKRNPEEIKEMYFDFSRKVMKKLSKKVSNFKLIKEIRERLALLRPDLNFSPEEDQEDRQIFNEINQVFFLRNMMDKATCEKLVEELTHEPISGYLSKILSQDNRIPSAELPTNTKNLNLDLSLDLKSGLLSECALNTYFPKEKRSYKLSESDFTSLSQKNNKKNNELYPGVVRKYEDILDAGFFASLFKFSEKAIVKLVKMFLNNLQKGDILATYGSQNFKSLLKLTQVLSYSFSNYLLIHSVLNYYLRIITNNKFDDTREIKKYHSLKLKPADLLLNLSTVIRFFFKTKSGLGIIFNERLNNSFDYTEFLPKKKRELLLSKDEKLQGSLFKEVVKLLSALEFKKEDLPDQFEKNILCILQEFSKKIYLEPVVPKSWDTFSFYPSFFITNQREILINLSKIFKKFVSGILSKEKVNNFEILILILLQNKEEYFSIMEGLFEDTFEKMMPKITKCKENLKKLQDEKFQSLRKPEEVLSGAESLKVLESLKKIMSQTLGDQIESESKTFKLVVKNFINLGKIHLKSYGYQLQLKFNENRELLQAKDMLEGFEAYEKDFLNEFSHLISRSNSVKLFYFKILRILGILVEIAESIQGSVVDMYLKLNFFHKTLFQIYTFIHPNLHRRKSHREIEAQLLELPSLSRMKTQEGAKHELPDVIIERCLSKNEGGEEITLEEIFQYNYKIQPALIQFIKLAKSPKTYLIFFLLSDNLRNILLKLKLTYLKKEVITRAKSEIGPREISSEFTYSDEGDDSLLLMNRNEPFWYTFRAFREFHPREFLQANIGIKFQDEVGIDGGGLFREWLTILSKQIFDPNFGLFALSSNKITVQPSPFSFIIPNYREYFKFIGNLLGRFMLEDTSLNVNFSRSFLKILLHKVLYINDFEDIDPEVCKTLMWMLENPVDDLDLNFTYNLSFFNKTISLELKENGANIHVTEENKKEYIKKFCHAKMISEIQVQSSYLLKGFLEIIPSDLIFMIDESELGLILSGYSKVDVKEMRMYAQYQNYEAKSPTIILLWEILEEFSDQEVATFLFFVTASFKVPIGGFKEFPIKLSRIDSNKLPIAHTCSRNLELPCSVDKETLREKLLLAIFDGVQGFEIG